MADPEHLAIIKQGVEVWNRWRAEHPEIQPNLWQANLRGNSRTGPDLSEINFHNAQLAMANLSGAMLHHANLSNAVLSGANLIGANLRNATITNADLSEATCRAVDFRGANLRKATLTRTDLNRADLTKADLRQAECIRTNLTETNCREADFREAYLDEIILGNTDLHATKGLDTCEFGGPSTIDHRTLVKSGHLPLEFLRGCGLPDILIDYLPSLLNEPIQRYSVFISYSHQDESFAKRLYDALQGKGVRCWYAPEHIQGGKKLHEQIDAAIRVYDKLLLILSDHSMGSEWVKTELANARRREVTENKRLLFPIRLVDFEAIRNWTCFDADTGKDSAREIREYFILIFPTGKTMSHLKKPSLGVTPRSEGR
jgi:TIR domain/Pentapeptide repeats (8 copies)